MNTLGKVNAPFERHSLFMILCKAMGKIGTGSCSFLGGVHFWRFYCIIPSHELPVYISFHFFSFFIYQHRDLRTYMLSFKWESKFSWLSGFHCNRFLPSVDVRIKFSFLPYVIKGLGAIIRILTRNVSQGSSYLIVMMQR